MFAIIISEKGGAERRESFDKSEINVGRVQGNDLMLPKGNVSKHHAKLLFRDGRFIVTDLKSTNGTYVNGRKIAQATIVREGDKIYIGDFVLRLDGAQQAAAVPEPAAAREEESIRTLSRAEGALPAPPQPPPPAAVSPAVTMKAQTHPPPALNQQRPQPVQQAPSPYEAQAQSSDDGAKRTPMQGTPQAPQHGRGGTLQPPPPSTAARAPIPPAPVPVPVAARPVPAPAAAAPRAAPRETAAQAGRRLALITLADRITDAVDLRALKTSPIADDAMSQQVERAAREQATAMREEGEAPEGIDIELLVRDAVREIVGLGPVGVLLDDEEVTEIHCVRHDQLLAAKAGVIALAEASFTSEESLHRVIARLAAQSGEPVHEGELVIERRLPRGATMIAIAPPAASGHVLVVRKRKRLDLALEDFVRAGTISRPIATFLETCIVARANILVSGSQQAGASSLVAALASLGPAGERIAVVHENEEINVAHAHTISLALADTNASGERTLHAAARLNPDRLVVGTLAGRIAAATIEAIADGAEGVIAVASASALRQSLARIASHVAMARPGMTADAARDAVGESFDIAVELVVGADGRPRIMRIAELTGADAKGVSTRDIFTYVVAPGQTEGAFEATGVVPRLVNELTARGIRVETAIFKRGPAR